MTNWMFKSFIFVVQHGEQICFWISDLKKRNKTPKSTAIENWWRKTGGFISKCTKIRRFTRGYVWDLWEFWPCKFPSKQGWGSPWTDGGNHPKEFVEAMLVFPRVFGWSRWPLAFSGPAGCCWCFLLFGIQTQEATPKAFLRMDKSVARKVDRIHGGTDQWVISLTY